MLHHSLFLAREYEGVQALAVGHKGVACHFVVADVGAEQDKGPRTLSQSAEVFETVDGDAEVAACIHGETVDDDLCEHVVVAVSHPKCLYRTVTPTLAEVMVDGLETVTEQTWRNDKYISEDIDNPNVYTLQQLDKPTMHQTIAVCRAFPLLLCTHRLIDFTLNVIAELAERGDALHLLGLDLKTEVAFYDDNDIYEVEAVNTHIFLQLGVIENLILVNLQIVNEECFYFFN